MSSPVPVALRRIALVLTFALLAALTGAGAASASTVQLVVSTMSPTDGATLTGAASWQVGVTGATPSRVEFAVDGVVRWKSTASPFLYGGKTGGLDTTTLANGTHTLSATAYGSKSTRAGTARVSVTVSNTAPTTSQPDPTTTSPTPTTGTQKLYWGARIDGDVYGRADAPWDSGTWDLFEQHAAKKVSLLHFGQPAPWLQAFARSPFDLVTSRGAVPYVSMNSDTASLSSIAQGAYDSSLTAWAQAAKSYGKPFFLRWDWEMNGTWFSWGAQAKSDPAAYVAAWRHFHDIVDAQGATNVTWVWCPNTVWSTSTPLGSLYPGNSYVDWTCMDGYNSGTIAFKPDVWKSFSTVMKPTYDQLLGLAPDKPILIGETGSTESGGSKAAWITDALKTQLPLNFPQVRALAWFNWNIQENGGQYDWQIESSSTAQAAFADGISLPNYATNTYGSLPLLAKVPLP